MKFVLYSGLILSIIMSPSYGCPSNCEFPLTEDECQQCIKSAGDLDESFAGGRYSVQDDHCQINGPKLHDNNCNPKASRLFKDCIGFDKAEFWFRSQRCWVVFKKSVCPPNCDSPKDQEQCDACFKSTAALNKAFVGGWAKFESVCNIYAPGFTGSQGCSGGMSKQFKSCSGFSESSLSYAWRCWAYFK